MYGDRDRYGGGGDGYVGAWDGHEDKWDGGGDRDGNRKLSRAASDDRYGSEYHTRVEQKYT